MKRWIYLDQQDPQKVDQLSAEINVNPSLSRILLQRSISNFTEAKTYFNPSLGELHDPFLMKGMKTAIHRLNRALENKERILIYGDYDVDGTTSVALVYGYLSQLTESLFFYINDREAEGYGISKQGILYAADNEVDLIISLDCGIKALEQVEHASSHQIDFIICDHHTPGEDIPNALAVLDPKQSDCNYPYKELSGCGIGYKLLEGLEKFQDTDRNLSSYLDLVAVSIAADVVPLTGENRILCYFGLKQLQSDPRPGLQALIQISSYAVKTITDVIFGIAPRINAAGRITHAHFALELLLSKTLPEAVEKAQVVNENNTERREFDSQTTQEALQMIDAQSNGNTKSTVLFKEDWHKGVIGIVASRCIEQYYRPTIILTQSNGSATGSARSIPGFNIYNAIAECEDLLEKFGGHDFAAGLTLPLENIPAFQKKFEEVAHAKLSAEMMIPAVEISSAIDFDYITPKFMQILDRMEPFGPKNPRPVFVADKVFVRSGLRKLKGTHVKFVAGQYGKNQSFDAIGFGLGSFYGQLQENMPMRMTFTIENNEYMGVKSIQLRIVDIKFDSNGIESR